jgi:hypothetical protein
MKCMKSISLRNPYDDFAACSPYSSIHFRCTLFPHEGRQYVTGCSTPSLTSGSKHIGQESPSSMGCWLAFEAPDQLLSHVKSKIENVKPSA